MMVIRTNNGRVTINSKFIESIETPNLDKFNNIITMVSGKQYKVDSHELFLIEQKIKG